MSENIINEVSFVNEEIKEPAEVVLDVKGLTKVFGTNHVLKGVDVEVHKGEVIVVLGPSGCGKSTFLRCLNCLEDPSGGEIIFDGENLADMKVNINKHRRKIGMVFQNFNLFNNKTVLKNIMLAPYTIYKGEVRRAKNAEIKDLKSKMQKQLECGHTKQARILEEQIKDPRCVWWHSPALLTQRRLQSDCPPLLFRLVRTRQHRLQLRRFSKTHA